MTQRSKKPNQLRIAIITDEFTSLALAPECDCIVLTPTNWHWKVRAFNPDCLFVESAWRGHKNSWKKKIAAYPENPHLDKNLQQIVEWFKQANRPTIFWNKEDPLHFDRFIRSASIFDYIYTTDESSVGKYEAVIGGSTNSIGVLMFAAQPTLHKYQIDTKRANRIAFIGGYYGKDLPDRSVRMDALFEDISKHPFIIYDRFTQKRDLSRLPPELQNIVRPSVSYKKACALYRDYKLYLNVNTIDNSKTMFSRRVFELGACGSCMLSTPSTAMTNIFGNLIPYVLNKADMAEQIKEFMGNTDLRVNTGNALREITLNSHTWSHRVAQIRSDIGL
jgi:spore maturation protein CgeB